MLVISVIQSFIIVILALIVEASLEAYFQFWLQSNYSLPDVFQVFLAENFNPKELLTVRAGSILLSFITIAFSIVKIRFKSNNFPVSHITDYSI